VEVIEEMEVIEEVEVMEEVEVVEEVVGYGKVSLNSFQAAKNCFPVPMSKGLTCHDRNRNGCFEGSTQLAIAPHKTNYRFKQQ